MRYFISSSSLGLFLLSMIDKMSPIIGAISKFSVIGDVFVNRSTDPISIAYNQTIIPYPSTKCHNIHGNFSVDNRGYDYPYLLNTSLDLFSWGINELNSVFNTLADWSIMSTRCALQTISEFANHTLFCNTNHANLAVFYNSPYPYRSGSIGFSNGNASVVLCKMGASGFIVAGYQPDWLPLTPDIPSASHTVSHDFNPLVLIPIIACGALLLATLIPYTRKKIASAISSCYDRLRGEEENPLLELAPHEKKEDEGKRNNYGT